MCGAPRCRDRAARFSPRADCTEPRQTLAALAGAGFRVPTGLGGTLMLRRAKTVQQRLLGAPYRSRLTAVREGKGPAQRGSGRLRRRVLHRPSRPRRPAPRHRPSRPRRPAPRHRPSRPRRPAPRHRPPRPRRPAPRHRPPRPRRPAPRHGPPRQADRGHSRSAGAEGHRDGAGGAGEARPGRLRSVGVFGPQMSPNSLARSAAWNWRTSANAPCSTSAPPGRASRSAISARWNSPSRVTQRWPR